MRGDPSLSANRVCELTHRFSVKIVAIGKEVTIDGITDPWVEVSIPRYEWKSDEPEYGWIFGGYLSDSRSSFCTPRTKNEIENFLKFNYWTSGGVFIGFEKNNYYWEGIPGTDIGQNGKWEIKNLQSINIKHLPY